ncbi:YSIRK-type signal peptide-containing protein [Streptococcus pseudopneumoniae]|uniref:YSIRK-type signal peptide-containing protein n=1 Tax=Streptococcus pseudopneumoniae TaxID=257758 RepID=UPI00352C9258
MFKKKNDGNGEKIFRYSIRKYHFGAASVAVAALMFFANGVQAQAPAVSSATASDVVAGSAGNSDGEPQESDGEEPEKVSQTEPSAELQSTGESNSPETKIEDASKGQETADLAPTKPEAKPAAQETSQSEREKEQDQPTSVTKTTEAKSLQGTLQALLEKLTLSSMKALHDEVESRLAAAKAVLDDPKATQAQVDEQVRAMEELTSRVNQALKPSLPKLTDLGEASSTNNKLSAPDGAVTEQASSGKRRKRGGPIDLEPAANQVSPTDAGKEAAPEANSQSTPRELPTYTNTTEGKNGAYGLKKELEDITKELRRYGASEDKIQAAKAAADKFNEAFSKGDTISQEDFAAALVDLKKSRDLIEGVLEEKYGEETTGGGVTPQPRDGGYSDFRNANYSGRSARAARAGENYSEEFKNAKESYFEKSGNKGNSPYGRYTYVYYSDRTPRNNATRPVSEAENYIKYTVTSTSDGFRWQLELNNGYRTLPGHSQMWFTVPSGQEFKHGTDGISISNQGGGTTAYSPNTSDILSLLKVSQAQFGRQKEGTPQHVGATNRFGIRPLPADNLTQLATQGPRGTNPYRRDYQSQEERSSADEKFRIINSSTGRLFYFELPNSNRKYKITFETRGNNDIKKLVYAAGMRFLDGHELLLANQWHARTRTEAEEDAKELNDAKTNAISAINAEADRKNREIDSANLLPADVTKLKQQVEAAKTNGITEVNRATSPQDVTTKKDTAVGAITGISLDEAKRNKAAKELNDAKTNAISAINDDGGQGDANNQDQPTTPSTPAHSGNSTDQATGPSAQQRGTGNSTEAESSQGLSEVLRHHQPVAGEV